jgi:hypothetical protein
MLKQRYPGLVTCAFPPGCKKTVETGGGGNIVEMRFKLCGDLFSQLTAVTEGSDLRLFVVLTTGLLALLYKF